MRRLLWVLAWISVAIWSLFAWGAYGLFDLFGGVAVRNADMVTNHPESVEWLSWALAVIRSLGLTAIVVVWAAISLMILAVPAVLGLFLGRPRPDRSPIDWDAHRRSGAGPNGAGMRPAEPVRRIERR
jgi:hypothetical protein